MNKKQEKISERIEKNAEMFNKGLEQGIYLARKEIIEQLKKQIKSYEKRNKE